MIVSTPRPPRRSSPSSPGRKRRSKPFWDLFVGKAMEPTLTLPPRAESSAAAQDRAAAAFHAPRQLPVCRLVNIFSSSDVHGLVPPSFYPGQTIPSSLSLIVQHHPALPLSLNPTLVMSLIGRVVYDTGLSRTITNISTPLDEGIRLWVRDASRAAKRKRPLALPEANISEQCLPQGRYVLPLSVQIPTTPGMAPTFDIADSTFKIVYELQVLLSCDHPDEPGSGQRVLLAKNCSPFELLPVTHPSRRVSCSSMSVWVNSESHASVTQRKDNTRWTVQPEIPTTTYSPSEMIPVSLILTPPPLTPSHPIPRPTDVILRVSLHRREHRHFTRESKMDFSGRSGLIRETEVLSRWGWFMTDGGCEIRVDELAMPLLAEGSWAHGYTTLLKMAKASSIPPGEPVAVSSTFHLCITAGFSTSQTGPFKPFSPLSSLRSGHFSATLGPSHPDFISSATFSDALNCSSRTLPVGIVIGSVAEPALSPVLGTPLMMDEESWLVPPPGYEEALKTVPYEH